MNQDTRYTDLMQEIKERLYVIEDVLCGRASLSDQLAHEFCFLQLRLICECIAFACVIANAYIKELQESKLQKEWSADELIKKLAKLHSNFYPEPKTIIASENEVHLEMINVPFLTKPELIKLNGLCGDRLHRGSPKTYAFNPTQSSLAQDRQMIINYGNKVFRLMEVHIMKHKDEARYILCRFKERGARVEVWFAANGDSILNEKVIAI